MMRVGGKNQPVDFMRASPVYVVEKINMLIHDLQWLKKRVQELEKGKNAK